MARLTYVVNWLKVSSLLISWHVLYFGAALTRSLSFLNYSGHLIRIRYNSRSPVCNSESGFICLVFGSLIWVCEDFLHSVDLVSHSHLRHRLQSQYFLSPSHMNCCGRVISTLVFSRHFSTVIVTVKKMSPHSCHGPTLYSALSRSWLSSSLLACFYIVLSIFTQAPQLWYDKYDLLSFLKVNHWLHY